MKLGHYLLGMVEHFAIILYIHYISQDFGIIICQGSMDTQSLSTPPPGRLFLRQCRHLGYGYQDSSKVFVWLEQRIETRTLSLESAALPLSQSYHEALQPMEVVVIMV